MTELRHICTMEGYFDHFFMFSAIMDNYKEAYAMTENILSTNFGINRYIDYASFRVAKTMYCNRTQSQQKKQLSIWEI